MKQESVGLGNAAAKHRTPNGVREPLYVAVL